MPNLKIQLTLKGINLSDVTIVSRVSKPFIVSTAGKIILNVGESPITAGDDAYSVLLRAPGIVEVDGNLIFKNKTVTVLIDGKLTHLSSDELKNMLSSMPANGIDRIEIISNPSANYDAAGESVINIILSKSKQDGFNGNFSTGVGSRRYFKYNDDLSLNYRNKDLNVYGSYDFMHNKQYYDNFSNRIINGTTNLLEQSDEIRSRFNNSYKFGIDYDLTKNQTIGVEYKGYTNYGNRTIYDNSDLKHTSGGDTSAIQHANGKVKFTNPFVSLNYTNKIDSLGQEFDFNADYLTFHKYWNDTYNTGYLNASGQPYLPASILEDNLPTQITNYSVTIDYTKPTKIGKFELGARSQFTTTNNTADYKNETGDVFVNDSTKSNQFIYKENINAGYFTYSNTFDVKYAVNIGLRVEQTNTDGDLITGNIITKTHYINFFPNIDLTYTEDENDEFALTYRKSIDRFGLGIVNPFLIYQSQYSYSQENPGIQPQLNDNYEFTYTFKKSFIFGASWTHTTSALVPVYVPGENGIVISTYRNLKDANLSIYTII